jgi:UDP-N-acetylglucosamine 2-epimerase
VKVLSVIGTRPEIVKLSCLFELLDEKFNHKILHSGQHYDPNLDRVIFRELKLKSRVLRLATGPGDFGDQFSRQIAAIYERMKAEAPTVVVVQGDTNTALAGAIVAARLKIPVVHVEAGCRSGNRSAPEEQNRLLIDSISSLHLCPDRQTLENLRREGHGRTSFVVGSTTFDAIRRSNTLADDAILRKLGLAAEGYIVCTLHRAENLEQLQAFKEKLAFVNELAAQLPVVFPAHPRTLALIQEKKVRLSPNVRILGPLPHLPFTALLRSCRLVVSDSGGIQEEAAFFNRPCLVLRRETEWVRLITSGKNFLFPKVRDKERRLARKLLEDDAFYETVRRRRCPESVPGASAKILRRIEKTFA